MSHLETLDSTSMEVNVDDITAPKPRAGAEEVKNAFARKMKIKEKTFQGGTSLDLLKGMPSG